MTEQSPSSPDIFEDDGGTSQLDVAMSFLAILLLNLFVLLTAASGKFAGTIEGTYVERDPTTGPAALRTFKLVYPFQEIWLVQNQFAGRVNLRLIASRVAASNAAPVELEFADGSSATVGMTPDLGLTGFVLTISRPVNSPTVSIESGLFDAVVPVGAASVQNFAAGSLLLVWPADVGHAFPLLSALQASGKNPQIAEVGDTCRNRWCPAIIRSASSFALEDVFR